MDQHPAYSYPGQSPPPTQRYSATSSAFSASAQPHEDWTKISDLAERRRIQNRIAQRNYRKKLKKRLEDLERRAASHSASPEEKPMEFEDKKRRRHSEQMPAKSPAHSDYYSTSPSVDPLISQPHYLPPIQDERNLFSHQYTRQTSTSPPPFACSPYPAEPPVPFNAYPPISQSMPTTSADIPLFTNYTHTATSYMDFDTTAAMYPPIKQEPSMAQDLNPFAMTFATMAGINVSAANAYTDSNPHTPPLMDFFEQSIAGTPPDTKCPLTPSLLPATPHLLLADDILNSL